jgi:hypothetical protein
MVFVVIFVVKCVKPNKFFKNVLERLKVERNLVRGAGVKARRKVKAEFASSKNK